jgi:hypothetical protein
MKQYRHAVHTNSYMYICCRLDICLLEQHFFGPNVTDKTNKHFMLNTQYFVTVTDIKQREVIAPELCPVCAVMGEAI